MITNPARSVATRKAATLSSRSSPTVVCQPTAIPISASRWLSHWLLVSRFWPLVNSVPTEMISAFMHTSDWFIHHRVTEDTEKKAKTYISGFSVSSVTLWLVGLRKFSLADD